MRAGDRVLRTGDALTPSRVALAAALGHAQVEVAQRRRWPSSPPATNWSSRASPLQPGQIHDSNRELLMGLLRAEGMNRPHGPRSRTTRPGLASALRDAASSFDVVITCGAVSAGEKDHIPGLLQERWTRPFLESPHEARHAVAVRRAGARAQVLGLPGNPVSVLATWLTLGRRLLDGLQGRREPRLRWHAPHGRGFRQAPRATGVPARPPACRASTVSCRLRRIPPTARIGLPPPRDSDVLIVLPEGEQLFRAGDVVEVLPY